MRNVADEKYQRHERSNNQEANAPQPRKPIARIVREFHAFPTGEALAAKNPVSFPPARRRLLPTSESGRGIRAVRIPRTWNDSLLPYPANLEIRENSGKYNETTMPPTTTPRNRIIIGSRRVSMSFTATSTSSS